MEAKKAQEGTEELKHEFRMEKVEDSDSDQQSEADFSVLTFNILADVYASKTIAKTRQQDLTEPLYWSKRGPLLRGFLKQMRPDIICMQEVDKHHDFFVKPLQKLGYAGAYAPRPYKREGCSTFWNANKYQLMQKAVVDYNMLKNVTALKYVPGCQTGNIGLITVLVPADGCEGDVKPIIVANTHLTWKPTRNDLRAYQVHMMLLALNRVKKELEPSSYPIVFCGDFNMCPEGVVYEYITQGCVEESRWQHAVAEGKANPGRNAAKERDNSSESPSPRGGRGRGGTRGGRGRGNNNNNYTRNNNNNKEKEETEEKEKEEGGGGKGFQLGHKFNFKSGYSTYTKDRGEPHYTNYTLDFKDCLDYIFYSNDALRLVGRMTLPPDEELQQLRFLPNGQHPSDHLPLMCSFKHTYKQ